MKIEYLSLKIPDTQGIPKEIAGPTQLPTGGLGPGGTGTNIIQVAINLLFVIGIILAIIYIIYSGIQWATSGGSKERIEKARKKLTYSIIGLIIITAAFGVLYPVLDSPNLLPRLLLLLLIPF